MLEQSKLEEGLKFSSNLFSLKVTIHLFWESYPNQRVKYLNKQFFFKYIFSGGEKG